MKQNSEKGEAHRYITDSKQAECISNKVYTSHFMTRKCFVFLKIQYSNKIIYKYVPVPI